MSYMAQITFRCSDAEKLEWSDRARRDGRSLGDWIKRRLSADFRREYRHDEDLAVARAHFQEIANKEPVDPPGDYDFSKMEVVKRGPGRKIVGAGSCDHKPFKRKDGLVVCEDCGVRL